MIGRVRDRATFAALARSRRLQRGAVTVRYVQSHDGGTPRVAFAIGRSLGGAVQRNRIRRRLRAAFAEVADDLEPGGAYLVGARPEAMTMPFTKLCGQVREAVRAAADSR